MDNSVDEALAGEADHVEIAIHPDNSVTVTDNGRGIPVDMHGEGGQAGRRGRAHRPPRRRQVRRRRRLQGLRRPPRRRRLGRQRALGAARPDDLARRPRVDPVLRARRAAGASSRRATKTDQRGTSITFLPDLEIFETIDYDRSVARAALPRDGVPHQGPEDRLQRRARRGLRGRASSTTAASSTSSTTCTRRARKDPLHQKVVYLDGRGRASARSRSRCSGTPPTRSRLLSFANNINTHEGGTHLSGLPLRAHAHDQRLRAPEGRAQGEGPEPPGRGRARGPHRDHLGEDPRPAVRGPDEDQARQPAGRGLRAGGRQPRPGRVPRGEPAEAPRGSSRRPSRLHAPARRRARRAT